MNEYGNDVDLDGELDRTMDPTLEPWEEQELDNQARKVQIWQQKKMAQQQQALTDKIFQDGFKETVEELGLSPEEAQRLMNSDDFETAKSELKHHVKGFYRDKLGRLRNKKGQFIKQPQGQAQQPRQSADPYATAPADLPDREKRVERAREIAAKSSGRSDDLDRMLEELLPASDPFVQY